MFLFLFLNLFDLSKCLIETQLTNFLLSSITEDTFIFEMRIWWCKIGIVNIIQKQKQKWYFFNMSVFIRGITSSILSKTVDLHSVNFKTLKIRENSVSFLWKRKTSESYYFGSFWKLTNLRWMSRILEVENVDFRESTWTGKLITYSLSTLLRFMIDSCFPLNSQSSVNIIHSQTCWWINLR